MRPDKDTRNMAPNPNHLCPLLGQRVRLSPCTERIQRVFTVAHRLLWLVHRWFTFRHLQSTSWSIRRCRFSHSTSDERSRSGSGPFSSNGRETHVKKIVESNTNFIILSQEVIQRFLLRVQYFSSIIFITCLLIQLINAQ